MRNFILFLLVAAGAPAFGQQPGLINAAIDKSGELRIVASQQSSANDFDWFAGRWKIRNRKLAQRLQGSNDWTEFDARDSVVAILNGSAYSNYYQASGAAGMSLTLFDPKTRLWSIFWADQNSGVIGTPVVGSFEGNIGTFYAKENFNGKPVLVRAQWELIDRNHAVWTQAFSPDNGKTWETNWYMHEDRVQTILNERRKKALMPDLSIKIPQITFDENGEIAVKASASSSSRDFDFLAGDWMMYHRRLNKRLVDCKDWTEFESTDENHPMLNGYGNMDILRTEHLPGYEGKSFEGVTVRLFDPKTRLWSLSWIPSNSAKIDPPQIGSFESNGVGHFFAKDTYNGIPVIVVFRWDARDKENPVWSQAFSADNGKTWEWNWANVSERKK